MHLNITWNNVISNHFQLIIHTDLTIFCEYKQCRSCSLSLGTLILKLGHPQSQCDATLVLNLFGQSCGACQKRRVWCRTAERKTAVRDVNVFITVYHRRKANWDPTHFMKLFLFLYVRCQVRRHCFAGCGENSKLLGSRHVNKNQRREGCLMSDFLLKNDNKCSKNKESSEKMRRVTPEGAAAVNRNLDALTTGLAWACMKQQKMPLPLNYECLALSCLHRGLPWLQCRFSRERRRRRHKQGDAAEAVCLSSASRTAVHRARQSDLRAGERFRVQIQKSVAGVINPAHGRKHLRWRLSAFVCGGRQCRHLSRDRLKFSS